MDGAPTLEVVFHEFRRQCLRGAKGCTRGELADSSSPTGLWLVGLLKIQNTNKYKIK